MSLQWSRPQIGGLQPSPRYGHTASLLLDGYIYFFGGWDGEKLCEDFWRFNPRNNSWLVVKSRNPGPSPRMRAASVSVGTRLIVHGGQIEDGTCLSDLWSYDAIQNEWIRLFLRGPHQLETRAGGHMELLPLECRPSPVAEETCILLVGGCSSGFEFLRDVLLINLTKKSCRKLADFPTGLAGRADMQAAFTKERLWILGGPSSPQEWERVWSFDCRTLLWDVQGVAAADSQGPLPRLLYSLTAYGSSLLMLGGRAVGGTASNEFWVLDLTSFSWTLKNDALWFPVESVYSHSACLVPFPSRVVFFGGRTGITGRLSSGILLHRLHTKWHRLKLRLRILVRLVGSQKVMEKKARENVGLQPLSLSSATHSSDGRDVGPAVHSVHRTFLNLGLKSGAGSDVGTTVLRRSNNPRRGFLGARSAPHSPMRDASLYRLQAGTEAAGRMQGTIAHRRGSSPAPETSLLNLPRDRLLEIPPESFREPVPPLRTGGVAPFRRNMDDLSADKLQINALYVQFASEIAGFHQALNTQLEKQRTSEPPSPKFVDPAFLEKLRMSTVGASLGSQKTVGHRRFSSAPSSPTRDRPGEASLTHRPHPPTTQLPKDHRPVPKNIKRTLLAALDG